MFTIDGRLKGIGPFLFNRYTTKARAGKLKTSELVEEAHRRVYKDDAGILVLPAWNLTRCFLDGARLGEVKHGRKSIGQYVIALMLVEGTPSFGVTDYTIQETLGRVPPRTGPMVTLYRPMLDPGWQLTFRLRVPEMLPPDTMKQIIEFAGLLAGLGAWRPFYGRFVLDAFDVHEEADGVRVPKTTRAKKA